jgi:hypothetical protein
MITVRTLQPKATYAKIELFSSKSIKVTSEDNAFATYIESEVSKILSENEILQYITGESSTNGAVIVEKTVATTVNYGDSLFELALADRITKSRLTYLGAKIRAFV